MSFLLKNYLCNNADIFHLTCIALWYPSRDPSHLVYADFINGTGRILWMMKCCLCRVCCLLFFIAIGLSIGFFRNNRVLEDALFFPAYQIKGKGFGTRQGGNLLFEIFY